MSFFPERFILFVNDRKQVTSLVEFTVNIPKPNLTYFYLYFREYLDGNPNLYIIKLIYIYMYIYMLAIASQTAGLNWMTFFKRAHGYPGGNNG